ncbi:MAG: cysteine hydrolase family protein [Candidatus Latescibacterota bacterium]|nr:cysteine hydrolase family protein [Candidatus Latescibacterota bacterium]MEE3043180.1 cysteine hydrolase family protein [Candidatus Latescibacterota bacterium]MEE3263258.1 cysteine hydrolase family protein [Candidatus Latescibacterota bacterium]
MGHVWNVEVDYYYLPRLSGMVEARFERRQLHWRLPTQHTALILVDVWSEHYITTHLARGEKITRERIAPLIETFDRFGAQVIHAPSPNCEPRYSHLVPDEAGPWRTGEGRDDWPPEEFRSKTGPYAELGRPQEARDEEFERIITERRVIDDVEPSEGDQVIFDGDQLHRLLHAREVYTLFYVGFAANMCVLHRDYGMRAMAARGYDVVLVRDATSAIEMADTLDNLEITAASVRDVEVGVGYSVLTGDLIESAELA